MTKSVLFLLLFISFNIYGAKSLQALDQDEQISNSNCVKNENAANILGMPFLNKDWQEEIHIFYDLSIPQLDFAANNVKRALENKRFKVELISINALTNNYPKRKIVFTTKDNAFSIKQFSFNIFETFSNIQSQGYAIRTFLMPGPQYVFNTARNIHSTFVEHKNKPETFLIVGGDVNGAMYGGIDLAAHIQSSGMSKALNTNQEAYLKYRGVKFNIPLDEKSPTYYNTNDGTSNKLAIRDVWDLNFWKTWFDEMALHKYNLLTLWNPHPFTAMLNMEDEYPGIAIHGVSGYDKNENVVKINDWTIDQKITFWKDVMKYGRERGFDIYFFTWNIFLSTAKDKLGLTTDPANAQSKTYFRKCMKKFLETYPDLAGFGITAGEAMGNLTNDQKEAWMWDTYGKGMMEYAQANPNRELVLVHRLLESDFASMMNYFKPLNDLPNVRFDISHKYSNAHAHAAAKPTYWDGKNLEQQLTTYNIKAWLTVRNDDFFFLHWADPKFVREYITSFPEVGKYVHSMYIGPDGWVFGREFLHKNPYYQNKNALEIQRLWYAQKIWGEIGYNPNISDDVFKVKLTQKYPEVSSNDLFDAWSKASRAVQLTSEQVTGDWSLDFHWWPEFWTHQENGYYKVRFSRVDPMKGSKLCNFVSSATNNCTGLISVFDNANNIEQLSNDALTLLKKFNPGSNTDLMLNLKNIEALAYLGLFSANKFRAITYDLQSNQQAKAIDAMGKAYINWIKYTNLMHSMYRGVKMQRNHHLNTWHDHDADVLSDLVGLGGPDDFNVENPYPWVYIKSPAATDYFVAPANIKLEINASAGENSVVSVQFKSNGVVVGTDTTFPYSFELQNLTEGDYTFEVLVTDDKGRTDSYIRKTKVFNLSSFNTTPWVEDFSLPDGTVSDTGPTSWTSARPDFTFFAVKNNEFVINGNGAEGVLTTSEIDISRGAVNISLDVTSGGSLESSDYVKLFKIVDDGAETIIDTKTGNQITKTTIEGTATGKKLVLKIKAKVSYSDEYYYMDNLSVKYNTTSVKDKENAGLPTQTQLEQNYPNPFNPETTISYQLAEPARARITIRNTLGQEINKLVDRDQAAGNYSVKWNGKDNRGNKVASGVYFYMLEVNNASYTKKLLLLE